MKTDMDFKEASAFLASIVKPVGWELLPLDRCEGRILAEDITASDNVPAFDRSPYDGYALRAEDTQGASMEHPVTLKILEEIPVGQAPSKRIEKGTAAKILTGAPIPNGADAVIMYEKTEFTDSHVTVFSALNHGENIIYAGEDVKSGQLLATAGTVIDPGLAGTLAAQGIAFPKVYKKPVAGIISTGNEIIDILPFYDSHDIDYTKNSAYVLPEKKTGQCTGYLYTDPDAWEINGPGINALGMIRNTNRYTLTAVLSEAGCEPAYLGLVGDDAGEISDLICKGLEICDIVFLTGGVSAGDYDLTPKAMEKAGCEILVKNVDIKPGMACCYGKKDRKLVCGLSGNPSSSLTNYYAVSLPAVRKLIGMKEYMPEYFTMELADEFRKKSKKTRLLKGKLKIHNGKAYIHLPKEQGNVVISSSIGCDCFAVVPPGSGSLEAGTELEGFLVRHING